MNDSLRQPSDAVLAGAGVNASMMSLVDDIEAAMHAVVEGTMSTGPLIDIRQTAQNIAEKHYKMNPEDVHRATEPLQACAWGVFTREVKDPYRVFLQPQYASMAGADSQTFGDGAGSRLETFVAALVRLDDVCALLASEVPVKAIADQLANAARPQKLPESGFSRPFDRDLLGGKVREAWVGWAKTQHNPKPSWLSDYDALSEADKEADRRIGEAVAGWVLANVAAMNVKGMLPASTLVPALSKDFIDALEGLVNNHDFWDEFPYSTRLYYGDGARDYVHRDLLRNHVQVCRDLQAFLQAVGVDTSTQVQTAGTVEMSRPDTETENPCVLSKEDILAAASNSGIQVFSSENRKENEPDLVLGSVDNFIQCVRSLFKAHHDGPETVSA